MTTLAAHQFSLTRTSRVFLSFALLLLPAVNPLPAGRSAGGTSLFSSKRQYAASQRLHSGTADDNDDGAWSVGRDRMVDDRRNVVIETKVGGSVVLECEATATGSPAPTLYWIHAGRRLVQNAVADGGDQEGAVYEKTLNNAELTLLEISATKSRLYLDCVTSRDAGQYTCVADGPNRQVHAVRTLVVVPSRTNLKHLAGCLKKDSVAADGAVVPQHTSLSRRVYMWTMSRLELSGADVQLFCRSAPTALGRPAALGGQAAATLNWFDPHNHKITTADKQYQLLKNGDLLIKNISFHRNMGTYRCGAESDVGVVDNERHDDVTTFLYPTSLE